MTRSLLLTGGAGFLGGHLARALLARGDHVTVLDDLSAASPLGLPFHPRLTLVRGDVRDPRAVEAALAVAGRAERRVREGRADEVRRHVGAHATAVARAPIVKTAVPAIVHLAAVVGVERVVAEPGRTDTVVRDGTGVMLDVARRHGAALLAFSSSEVTDAPRHGPRAVYAEAKADAERLLLQAGGCLALTVLRPFNVVGRGQSAPGSVLPRLAARARLGAPLELHGEGEQERCFLHVDDLVDALLALLERPVRDRRELLEIGGELRTSIVALARSLARAAGRGSPVLRFAHAGAREDRARRLPDLSALRAAIAFTPRRGWDVVLRDALAPA